MAKKEDNRDIFDKALDGAEVFAPAVGAVAGGILGRRMSRSMHNIKLERAKRDLEMLEKTPHYKFEGGRRQRDREISEAQSVIERDYKKGGATLGAVVGGIAGYGASDISSNARKRRK